MKHYTTEENTYCVDGCRVWLTSGVDLSFSGGKPVEVTELPAEAEECEPTEEILSTIEEIEVTVTASADPGVTRRAERES